LPLGINDQGQIVGYYTDASGAAHGFLYSNGQFTTLDDPNAGTGNFQGTLASRINNAGQIIGEFVDGNNVQHGFLATPTSSAQSAAGKPALPSGSLLIAAGALTSASSPRIHGLDASVGIGANGNDGLRAASRSQTPIAATVPRTSPGSSDTSSGRVYVVFPALVGASKHPDPASAVFEEAALWFWQ